MSQKSVLIGYPLDGDDQSAIIEAIVDICSQWHDADIVPYSPDVLSLTYFSLKDEMGKKFINIARRLGLGRGFADELWLFGDHLTQDMKEDMMLAITSGVPVYGMTYEIKNEIIACEKEYRENRPPPGTRLH
ncbi:MAG TPA: hypothetical protein VJB70_03965 [Candidatus Paceibacterota bacterium]